MLLKKRSAHDVHKPKKTTTFFEFKKKVDTKTSENNFNIQKEVTEIKDTIKNTDFKNIYLFLIILSVLIIVSLTALAPKNCGRDKDCFNEESKRCSKSIVKFYEDNNLFEYKVTGKQQQYCRINIHVLKANPSLSGEDKLKIEDKDMTCKVPYSLLAEKGAMESEEISFYCTGPLKEGLLEITTEKLYGVVVSNIGKVALEFQNILNETKGIV